MKVKFTIKAFLISTLVEGVISLIILFLIPGDPKNAWLLGLSKSRFAMVIANILAIALIAIFTGKITKNQSNYTRVSTRVEDLLNWDGHLTTGFVFSLAGFVTGFYFLIKTFTITDQFLLGYYDRLLPWTFWFTAISGGMLLFLILQDIQKTKNYFRNNVFAFSILLVILCSGIVMHDYLWELPTKAWDINKLFNQDGKFDLEQQDIYAVFTEGGRLQQGENPYARVLDQDNVEWNQTNATYLPIFYYLSWLSREAGLDDYLQWLGFWRVIFLIFNIGIAYLLFYIPYHRYNSIPLASFAALFWLFNRWTLHLTMIYHIDFIAIFFFLFSLATWPKHRLFSLLGFGLSLGIKQMALFMIPIYLIWIWQSLENRSLKRFIGLSLVMVSIPLIVSAPFLVWNAEGFLKSILISATRNAESHFGIPSIDTLIGFTGIAAKLPMLGLMLVVYWLVWERKINEFVAALFIMAVFVDFNSVLFRQYMTWVVPLIPLGASYWISKLSAHPFRKN
jgi:hypothetical protein